jgi:hypothetical protein
MNYPRLVVIILFRLVRIIIAYFFNYKRKVLIANGLCLNLNGLSLSFIELTGLDLTRLNLGHLKVVLMRKVVRR